MLIEDDTTMTAVLSTLLELEGYEVAAPQGGASLDGIVQAIRDCHPDVILLDVHLRHVNGLDILKNIRADVSISETRVVMSSGMDVKESCIQGGANDFLMKPFMPDELLTKLNG